MLSKVNAAWILVGAVVAACAVEGPRRNPYEQAPGLVTVRDGDSLWVFFAGSPELRLYTQGAEPARPAVRERAGPGGLTLKSHANAPIDLYLSRQPLAPVPSIRVLAADEVKAARWRPTAPPVTVEELPPWPEDPVETPRETPKEVPPPETGTLDRFERPGFALRERDGRIWIFRSGSEALGAFERGEVPAERVSLVGAGPAGRALHATDRETATAYVAARPGFAVALRAERIWVFREGSEDLVRFREEGEPSRYVTRRRSGPMGLTVNAPDRATIEEYLGARPGFVTRFREGRLWVLPDGSGALSRFMAEGPPESYALRPAAAPGGADLCAVDEASLEAYLAAPAY